ncbi:MarR family transcriptional regulator [Roseobacter sp. YSTF-M11]|uniref:MarR family transcriptional regulator n=1 Tax=Roseobacter insulae TaxID=2859783 RepID=A0A9X1FZM1_9RHOB|nr:MarR family transcriptional regulator [Roseobacter insulae]MBW4710312.1 MarR family transcriptional regulator [Roseobacter insulae]
MPDTKNAIYFEVFNEIGIIEQLSRTLLEARLPHGLIAPHFAVLNHLIRLGDGRALIDIARAFQVPKTTMTHTIKCLETNGLVAVRPNPRDGRSKLVWLTSAGRALRAKAIADLYPDFERLAAGFKVDRLQDILPVLKDLRAFLDEDRNGPHDKTVLQAE